MIQKIAPVTGSPSVEEIKNRISKVQDLMKEQGLDYYLCFDPANVFYLTNFANFVHERPFILLVPQKGRLIFLMPKLEEAHVKIRSVGDLAFLHYFEFPAPETEQWSDKLKTVLMEKHTVGIEPVCPVSICDEIPGTVRKTDIVDEVRMIKSEYEIGRIAYVSDLVSKGHAQLLQKARPGRMIVEIHSEVSADLTRKLLKDNRNSNLLNTKFAVIAQPPKISHDPHNFTDTFMQFAEGGPHVTISSSIANGYGAEVERTFFINSVPEKAKAPFNHMLEARALAYELTVPGNSMSEVDRKVSEYLKSKGYGPNLLHRTGHSFGVTNHEGPFLAEGDSRIIQPGMVFSIEPGFYIPDVGGFRFSDTVLITETGNQKLTSAPESMEELTIVAKSSIKDSLKSMMVKLFTKSE